jgi:hypothetical protein
MNGRGDRAACSAIRGASRSTQHRQSTLIFAYDTIFGPDEVVVASSYPEGCNKLRQITLQRSADRVSFAAHYDFFEPCQPGATVFDQDRAWHPAGADMTWIDIDYPGFAGPGRYLLTYQAPANRAVAIPITVLRASTISNVVLTPTPPATLAAGDSLKVRFQYSTSVNGAIAVQIRPANRGRHRRAVEPSCSASMRCGGKLINSDPGDHSRIAMRATTALRRILLPAVLIAASCGGDSTEPESPAEITSVALSPSTATLEDIGASAQFEAVARTASGAAVQGQVFSWTSADPDIASVANNGVVTGTGFGTTTITAMTGSASGSAVVIVARPVTTVTVTPDSAAVLQGSAVILSAHAHDSRGDTIGGQVFDWESTNPGVAQVDTTGRVTASSPGMTSIRATSAGVSGTATITVPALPAGVLPLHCGDLLNASIDQAAEIDQFVFAASAGDIVLISLSLVSGLVVDATILAPVGGRLDGFRASQPFQITLPETGLYTVRVNTATLTSTSNYNIGLECILPAGPIDAALSPRSLVPGSIVQAGQVDMFTFNGTAGDDLLIPIATTAGVVVDATLLNPAGAVLRSFRAARLERLSLPASGTYTLFVRTATFRAAGNYNVGLERLRPPGAADAALTRGVLRTDTLHTAGDVDLLQFDGQAGSTVLVSIANLAGIVVSATIVAPSGNAFQTLRAASQMDVALPETGAYTIYVHTATLSHSAIYNIGIQ